MSTIMPEIFRHLIVQKYRNTPKHLRKLKRLKGIVPVFPMATEHQYAKELTEHVFKPVAINLWQRLTQENYERWLKDYRTHDSVDIRLDSYADEINTLIGSFDAVEEQVPGKEITQKAAVGTLLHSRDQWKKETQQYVGIPFSTDEAWFTKTREAWIGENLNLIKSQTPDVVKKISNEIYSSVRSGTLWPDLKEKLTNIVGFTDGGKNTNEGLTAKAKLIARDQIGKLNGQISKYRQTEIGVEKYTWLAVGDERECEFCGELDGSLCQWDDNTVYSLDDGKTWEARPADCEGDPGDVHPQCRCLSVAFMDDILDSAQDEVEGQENPDQEEEPKKTYEEIAQPLIDKFSKGNLSKAEIFMFNSTGNYQSFGHKILNKILRENIGATKTEEKQIEAISKFINKNPLSEKETLYRGMILKAPLTLKAGDVFSDKAFSSFTSKKIHAESFLREWGQTGKYKYLIEYEAEPRDSVTPLIYNANYAEPTKPIQLTTNSEGVQENEFLVQKNFKLRIKSISEKENITTIKVESAEKGQEEEQPAELTTADAYEGFIRGMGMIDAVNDLLSADSEEVERMRLFSSLSENLVAAKAIKIYNTTGDIEKGYTEEKLEKMNHAITAQTKKFPIKKSVNLYRGAILPDFKVGDTWRDSTFPFFTTDLEHTKLFLILAEGTSEGKESIFKVVAKPGDPITPGIRRIHVLKPGTIQMIAGRPVEGNTGRTVAEYNSWEKEFIGARGLKFKVVSKEEKDGIIYYEMEIVR